MAPEVSNNEEASSHDDRGDLVHRPDNHIPVAALLRPGGDLRRRSEPEALPGGVAAPGGRHPLLPDRQSNVVLRPAHDTHLPLLHSDLDQSMATAHPVRHEGRPDGEDTAKVEGEGGEDAGRRRDPVRAVMAASLRDLHGDQTRRRRRREGGRDPAYRHADRSMARRQQLLHQPDPLRFLQQEIPAWLRRHPQERTLLRQDQVLRDGGHDVLVDQHEEVVVLRQQQ